MDSSIMRLDRQTDKRTQIVCVELYRPKAQNIHNIGQRQTTPQTPQQRPYVRTHAPVARLLALLCGEVPDHADLREAFRRHLCVRV